MSNSFEAGISRQIAANVADTIRTAREEGLGKLPELVCFDIAQHVTFEVLNRSQADEFCWRMKRIISAHSLQKARRK